MSFRSSWRRRPRSWQASRSSPVAALAVSGSAFGGGAQSCGTVTINEQSWAGSTANTYVAKYVLEKRLGCKVKITNVTEGTPYFQAMRDGKIDVALEDWDNTLEQVGAAVHQGQVRARRRLERDHRRHRLVHPAVPAQAVPGDEVVEGHQGQGDASSSRRSRARRACSSAAIRRTSRRTGR